MTDRKQALFGLDTPDDKNFMSQMCDKADRAQKTGKPVYTKFFAPREQNMISERLSRFCDIKSYGGYPDSERNMMCFFDRENLWEEFDFPLTVLKIMPTNKKEYSHRDYLGAILSLGIKRELIGDIVINESTAYVFCHNEISDYIMFNLEKIANARVVITVCDVTEISVPQRSYKQKDDTISSLRLDCVISAALNMSRGNSLDVVKRGLVCHNYEQASSPSVVVKSGDIISVRGFGKFEVYTDGNLTKKGRYHIQTKKYI